MQKKASVRAGRLKVVTFNMDQKSIDFLDQYSKISNIPRSVIVRVLVRQFMLRNTEAPVTDLQSLIGDFDR